ncbi:COQ9 family protein [Novosphingobium sp. FSY-8]|uniref:COQ9 family protein n=1 Tax=Novosphingobium ovatum TaxID=1908523 RepID=A0ABW9XFH4_9SPHN|nr:COQ9 family protein [Novosphingobium ovatum]NBC37305.1 COQ9 family protein [Novosphingobium ovatum]
MQDDQTLDAIRLRMAPALADAAVFDGWTAAAVADAAAVAGVPADVAAYAFAGGPVAMIAAWVAHIDAEMTAALPADLLAKLPVRERIRRQLAFRLMAVAGREEALRRAQTLMAHVRHMPDSLRMGWASADLMWRQAGDRAADYNHYTKRTTLAAIYAACLAVVVNDTSPDKAETMAFLERRIDGIMRFEKAKAQLLRNDGMHFSPVRLLGRLRYPAR